MSNSALVPEAKQGLARFKNEVAQELGVPFKEYNGDLSSCLLYTSPSPRD